MQLLNVARGGNLQQHLADLGRTPTAQGRRPALHRHEVTVLPDTRLAGCSAPGRTPTRATTRARGSAVGWWCGRGRGRHRRGGRGSPRRSWWGCSGIPRRTPTAAPAVRGAGRPARATEGGWRHEHGDRRGPDDRRRAHRRRGGAYVRGHRSRPPQPLARSPRPASRTWTVPCRGCPRAYESWAALSPVNRGRAMHRFATMVEHHAEELALIESRNVGMPIADARGQLSMIVDVIRYYAGAVDKFFGQTIPVERDGVALTFREPIGVVGADHALELPAQHRQLEGRAGARGRQHGRPQAGVADAADRRCATPSSRSRPGIPPGVLNVVPGRAATVGDALVEHPGVGKIGFTGSTAVGAEHRAPRRGHDQAGHARAGRQVGLRRLRRRRPREGRAAARPTRSSGTAARTAARARGCWSRSRSTTSCSSATPPRRRRCGWACPRTRRPRSAR